MNRLCLKLVSKDNVDRYKVVFISGLVFSILNHVMVLTNKFSLHDDIGNIFTTGGAIDMGRWFLSIIKHALIFLCGSVYSMPFYCGFIALLSITIFSLVIYDLFDIYNKYYIVLITGICISLPTVSSFLGYTFVVAPYFFMYMLSALSVLLICKYRNIVTWIISVLFLICSIGTYQGVIPIIICMINIYIIKCFVDNKYRTSKEFIVDILFYIFTLLIVISVYIMLTYFFLKISNKTLTSYRSMDSVPTTSIAIYLKRICAAYKEFFAPNNLIKAGMFPYFSIVVYFMFILIYFINSVILMSNVKQNNSIIIQLCCLLTILFLPISINFIYIMVDENVNVMMLYQIIFVFVYCFSFINIKPKIWYSIFNYLSICCLSIFILLLIRFNNSCYLKAEMKQMQIINYYNNVISRIQSVEGYSDSKKICFYSDKYPSIKDNSYSNIAEFDLLVTPPYSGLSINTYTYKSILKMWCGFEPEYVEPKLFENNDNVLEMPCYPDDGSIGIIDDVIVVKFKQD